MIPLRSSANAQSNPLLLLLTLTLTLLLAVCTAACDEEKSDKEPVVGKLVVSPQLTLQVVNQVYVPVVELNRPGWVVIYTDEGGTRGTVLGQTLVTREVSLNVEVELSRGIEDGETLHAVLHLDRGTEGTFEPERDPVVEDENGEIDRTFEVFVDVDSIVPTLVVEDRSYHPVNDDLTRARITEAAVREGAWVVVYDDAAFGSDRVLGQTSLRPGISRRVEVRLNRAVRDGETLHARIHVERSNGATFDPASDPPMTVDGSELTGSFVVTIQNIEVTPELSIEDQTASPPNRIVVDSAVSRGQGFVAIYADDDGDFGELLGHAALSAGDNDDVVVTLSRDAVDQERLRGRLHEDRGTTGTFEPGTDTPMQRDGNDVVDDFVVTVHATLTPSVTVTGIAPLSELSTVVVVPSATSVGPGWLVIHADQGGSPGDILGHAPLDAGTTNNVTVMLSAPVADGATLYAMLHADSGTIGTFEAGDAPVTDDQGNVIAPAFTASVPAGTPAVRVTITATDSSDYTITEFYPPTVASPLDNGTGPDPELTLRSGWRYELVNQATGAHPFELVTAGANPPDDDVVQLSQVADGALEADAGVAWEHSGNTMRFTVTSEFASAVDTYRCEVHPADMRGTVSAN